MPASGWLYRRNGEQYLCSPGQVADIAAVEQVIVTHRDGVPISIRDLADGSRQAAASGPRHDGETVLGTAVMLIGRTAVRYRLRSRATARGCEDTARRRNGKPSMTDRSCGQDDRDGAEQSAGRRRPGGGGIAADAGTSVRP